MISLTKHVLITVVNSAAGVDKNPGQLTSAVSEFDPSLYVIVSAMKSLRGTRGNKYKNQDIVKEAFSPDEVTKVYQAFGLVGANFDNYTAFKKSDMFNSVDRNVDVFAGEEIVLIRNDLLTIPPSIVANELAVHRTIPARKT